MVCYVVNGPVRLLAKLCKSSLTQTVEGVCSIKVHDFTSVQVSQLCRIIFVVFLTNNLPVGFRWKLHLSPETQDHAMRALHKPFGVICHASAWQAASQLSAAHNRCASTVQVAYDTCSVLAPGSEAFGIRWTPNSRPKAIRLPVTPVEKNQTCYWYKVR